MRSIITLLYALTITGCATEQSIAYEKARYEANPNYQDESNQSSTPLHYTPKDRNYAEYMACLFKFNQRFNSADSRWICE